MVVHVPVAGLHVLDRRDALVLGLVREHGSEGAVTVALQALDGGAEMVVDDDAVARVDFDAGLVESRRTPKTSVSTYCTGITFAKVDEERRCDSQSSLDHPG